MEIKMNVLLVVNPISGNNEKDEIIEAILMEKELRKFNLTIYETVGKDDATAIQKLVIHEKIDRLIVAGGDGTIQLIANAVINMDVIVGILPAGSANGLAVNFEIPAQLKEQIEIALGDSHLKIDTLEINGEHCLHIADMGINAELIRNYDGSSIRGKLGYLLQTVPTLWNSEYPYDFEIDIEGEKIQKSGVMLAFANANTYGTGANINPTGKMNDGFFELLIFKNLGVLDILKTWTNSFEMDPSFVEKLTIKSAKIVSKRKIPFQIDGEYQGEVTTVSVCIHPKAMTFALPESYYTKHNC